MHVDPQTPTYNLKAVVHETGLKPDTLRAWERRYGLPNPQRSAGGHRLYAQADIDTLKWLMARQNEGMSISRAVELFRKLSTDGRNPLRSVDGGVAGTGDGIAERPTMHALAAAETVTGTREAWVAACLAFDERTASAILDQAFAFHPPETVCIHILVPALATIGDGWHKGKVSVQQEHFASGLAVRRLQSLMAATPPPTRAIRIVVGCAEDEEHVFVPLVLSLLLRRQGLDVICLGAAVPLIYLLETIRSTRTRLVLLVAQQLVTAANLMEMAETLNKDTVPVAYGGRIFANVPETRRAIPGHYLGDQLEMALSRVEQILTRPTPQSAGAPPPPGYKACRLHFGEKKAAIESDVWRRLSHLPMAPGHLARATASMAQNMDAALRLGNIQVLSHEVDWVHGLLGNFGIPQDQLVHFLRAYDQTLRTHLDERGNPILDWLAQQLAAANRSTTPTSTDEH